MACALKIVIILITCPSFCLQTAAGVFSVLCMLYVPKVKATTAAGGFLLRKLTQNILQFYEKETPRLLVTKQL